MTQEIVCLNDNGVIVCSDTRVVFQGDRGLAGSISLQKLYPLGSRTLIASAGAKVGIDISVALKAHEPLRRLERFADIVQEVKHFAEEWYATWLREWQGWFEKHPEAFRRLHFVLAGYEPEDPENPFRVALLGSEDHRLPFEEMPVGKVITVPRRLGIEARLARIVATTPLDVLAAQGEGYLRLLAEKEPDQVGGPFYIGVITRGGVTLRRLASDSRPDGS